MKFHLFKYDFFPEDFKTPKKIHALNGVSKWRRPNVFCTVTNGEIIKCSVGKMGCIDAHIHSASSKKFIPLFRYTRNSGFAHALKCICFNANNKRKVLYHIIDVLFPCIQLEFQKRAYEAELHFASSQFNLLVLL